MQRIDWVKKKMRLREPEIRDFNAARWGALPVSCFFHMPFLKMGTDIWHQHQDFYELVVVVDGTFWDEYPGGCDMLRAGNFFIYAPESVHHYRQMNNCRYYNVLFAADLENYTFLKRETLPAGLGQFLPDKGRRSALFSLGAANLAGIVAVLEDMCRENVTRQDGWKEMLISQLVRLLIHLRRCAEAPVPEPDATLAFTVEKAMDFMEKHMLEDLTLAQLARHVSMSESSFRHRFKEMTGFPPLRYLLVLRLKYALTMLFLGRSVPDCARLARFGDTSHFGRIFKKYLGFSPHQTGRMLLNDKGNLDRLSRQLMHPGK